MLFFLETSNNASAGKRVKILLSFLLDQFQFMMLIEMNYLSPGLHNVICLELGKGMFHPHGIQEHYVSIRPSNAFSFWCVINGQVDEVLFDPQHILELEFQMLVYFI